MSVRRLSLLQWLGLVAGGIALGIVHLSGIAAGCAGDTPLALLSAGACVTVLAAAAAALVIARTQASSYDDDPPLSRIRFFAIAALVANVLFTGVLLLDVFGNVFNTGCRQS